MTWVCCPPTVTTQDALRLPHLTVIVAVPAETAATMPFSTVATDLLLLVHSSVLVPLLDGVNSVSSAMVSPGCIDTDVLSRDRLWAGDPCLMQNILPLSFT